jgi:hypothetical protein
MTPSNTFETIKADPPFDDQNADVIVRSSDNVDFYVFKSLLAYSSSVFKDMFCVAQGCPNKEEMKDNLQVISTNESAETWRILLRFSYPSWAVGPPALNSLDEFSMALESSRKYGMTGTEKMIVADLVAPRFVEIDPMRVFALAYRFGLEAEARVAAKRSLHLSMIGRPYFVEMESMTAGTLHQLQQYHFQCAKVASDVAKDIEWIENLPFVWFDRHDVCGKEGRSMMSGIDDWRIVYTHVATWWYDYMQSAATALQDRPVGVMVLDPDLMDSAVTIANLCPKCSPRAFSDMRGFVKMFAAQVDRVVEEVSCIRFGTPTS